MRRLVYLLVAGIGLLVLLMMLHTGLGKQQLTVSEVALAILNDPVLEYHRKLVVGLRIPRGLVAVAAGAMLGLAGALLQAVVRNPLADPSLLGITGGGVLFAVVVFGAVPGLAVSRWLPFVVLVGCLATGGLVLSLARSRHGLDPWILVLTGIVVGGVATSLASVLLLRQQQQLGAILPWMIGSLNGRVWVHWNMIWPWMIAGVTLVLLSSRVTNIVQLGDESSVAAGAELARARVLLFGLASLLTAAAVSVVGAVGFVGLMAPHLAQRFIGIDARRLLPVTALVGAALLLAADIVSQGVSLQPPFRAEAQRVGVPVGAVTALFGAPLVVWLMRRSAKVRR